MFKEKSCGAIVCDGDRILLIRHNAGHWSFPKGHVENNETEEETAYREILEETGFVTRIDNRFRYVVTYSPKEGVLKDVVYFLAIVIEGEGKPQLEEVSEIKWVSIDDAYNLITFDNDKNVLRAAKDYLG